MTAACRIVGHPRKQSLTSTVVSCVTDKLQPMWPWSVAQPRSVGHLEFAVDRKRDPRANVDLL